MLLLQLIMLHYYTTAKTEIITTVVLLDFKGLTVLTTAVTDTRHTHNEC